MHYYSPISDKYSKLHSQMKISQKNQSVFTLKYLHAKKKKSKLPITDCECVKIRHHTADVRLYWSAKTGQPLSLKGLNCQNIVLLSSGFGGTVCAEEFVMKSTAWLLCFT